MMLLHLLLQLTLIQLPTSTPTTHPPTTLNQHIRPQHQPTTPLHQALDAQCHDCVQSLLSSNYIDTNTPRTYDDATPLNLAIQTTNVFFIRAVLQMGGLVNDLHTLRHSSIDYTSSLYADSSTNPRKFSSLILALKSSRFVLGYLSRLFLAPSQLLSPPEELLDIIHHIRAHISSRSDSRSTLPTSISMRDIRDAFDARTEEIVRVLLEAGATVDVPDMHGDTALLHAARLGFRGAVSALLAAGANCTYANKNGLTSLDISFTQGFVKLEQLLREDDNCKRTHHLDRLAGETHVVNADGTTGQPVGDTETPRRVRVVFDDDLELKIIFFQHVIVRRLPLLVKARKNKEDRNKWTIDHVQHIFGFLKSRVSIIPYSLQFGLAKSSTQYLNLTEYITIMKQQQQEQQQQQQQQQQQHDVMPQETVKNLPLYWFSSLRHNKTLEKFVEDQVQTPPYVNSSKIGYVRDFYEFFIGSHGTGSPQHLHNSAWNLMLSGKKEWFFWSPGAASITTTPPLKAYQEWKQEAEYTCIQEDGDVVLIPEDWGHATFSLGENVGFAAEYSQNMSG